jgi:hypothetical protein
MELLFRILDLNVQRQKRSERILLKLVKAYGLEATIYLVHDFLEFGRLGVADKLPGLELNGTIISTGRNLSKPFLEEICRRLSSPGKKY